MKGTCALAFATGKALGRQQDNPPRPVINTALVGAVAVITGKQPRMAAQRDDHHDPTITFAIAVYADAGGTRRIALDGKVGQINRQIRHQGSSPLRCRHDAVFKQTSQSRERACTRCRKADLEILPYPVAAMFDHRRGCAIGLAVCFGA